jgi:NAD+ synthase (glutamine-hydrolysing)
MAEILKTDWTRDMLCDFGMPVVHRNVRYNCRTLVYDRKILLIRPKRCLANHGNYRETRWFSPWLQPRQTEEYLLPSFIRKITGQTHVPFGDAVIATLDTTIGCETCEELFTPESPHIDMGLNGVEIIANGSASHHELRKLHVRLDLIKNATRKVGGIYLYANLMGCDGERVYYDGCSMIAMNGELYAHTPQFSMREVEIAIATLDLEDVRTFRGASASWAQQANTSLYYPRIHIDMHLSITPSKGGGGRVFPLLTSPFPFHHNIEMVPEEEIRQGPACWLWDYLRRSGASGFFLPLSGGADSGSVALIVYSMCQMLVTDQMRRDGPVSEVYNELKRILKEENPHHLTNIKYLTR